MVLEVQPRVVDPHRLARLKRREGELLPEARHQVQAGPDVLHELVVAGRRALEDQHGADVHVRAVVLLGQEAGVGGAEAIEVRWSHGSDPPAAAVAERWKLTVALPGVKRSSIWTILAPCRWAER